MYGLIYHYCLISLIMITQFCLYVVWEMPGLLVREKYFLIQLTISTDTCVHVLNNLQAFSKVEADIVTLTTVGLIQIQGNFKVFILLLPTNLPAASFECTYQKNMLADRIYQALNRAKCIYRTLLIMLGHPAILWRIIYFYFSCSFWDKYAMLLVDSTDSKSWTVWLTFWLLCVQVSWTASTDLIRLSWKYIKIFY